MGCLLLQLWLLILWWRLRPWLLMLWLLLLIRLGAFWLLLLQGLPLLLDGKVLLHQLIPFLSQTGVSGPVCMNTPVYVRSTMQS